MRLPDPPAGLPWALYAMCGASLLLNVVLGAKLLSRTGAEPAPAEVVAAATVVEPAAPVAEDANPATSAEVAVASPLPKGMKVVHAPVRLNLARTFQDAVKPAKQANVVSAVYARLFFWELNLRRDLQKGDSLQVAYTWDGELADIPVATYTSSKLGTTLQAYRFQASGDTYPSWWDEEGRETSRRLNESPLHDYEQVTSLLKDRPRHHGMDFKVPVGEDVLSPRAGTVTRTNWNLANNGNCVEVRFRDGTLAKFLHLSETGVQPGQALAAGGRVGASGNTGHSTAPHLHYELQKGGRVIDPVDYHGTFRRELPAADRDAFEAERLRLMGLLEQQT